jgi:hypothetical protein
MGSSEGLSMAITELVVRLLVLFFPGIICFYLVDALTVHRERKPYEVFLLSFVYGVLCYLVFGAVHFIAAGLAGTTREDGAIRFAIPDGLSVISVLSDAKASLNFSEIAWVTVVSVFVAFFMSSAINKKWLNTIAQKLKISRKFGDLNVWSYVLNADNVEWATIRDMEHNLMFMGRIQAFSDIDETAEIVLSDVVVYDEKTGEELYKAARMYLSRKRENLIIELPYSPKAAG